MKFLNRVKRFIRWCFASPTGTSKSSTNLTRYEKELLLKTDTNPQSVTTSKDVFRPTDKFNKQAHENQKYKVRHSEHNK